MSDPHILFAASENAALHDAKVGGVGDVCGEVPLALARQQLKLSVCLPSYGFLHTRNPIVASLGTVPFRFRGEDHHAKLLRVAPKSASPVDHYLLHHELFANPGEPAGIYFNDPHDRPFGTDANKFAAFCAALASAMRNQAFGNVDIYHLNDWQCGFLFALRELSEFADLQHTRTVFTIHNLSLQGIRPLAGDTSSLYEWFPELRSHISEDSIRDPRWDTCFNPMASAIRKADAVHVVSPHYAQEIQQPSDVERGWIRGEGLEQDLRHAAESGRLHGILNGTEYPPGLETVPRDMNHYLALLAMISDLLDGREGEHWASIARPRLERLRQWGIRANALFTYVGRLVDQKARLLFANPEGSESAALDHILQLQDGAATVILLGTGDSELERRTLQIAENYSNLIPLFAYSEDLAEALYTNGDFFLMPSSFEPCGISQMRAMRRGQPCLVNACGGLVDTVQHNVDGLVFDGNHDAERASRFVDLAGQAIQFCTQQRATWNALSSAAASRRFTWDSAAEQYCSRLYGF